MFRRIFPRIAPQQFAGSVEVEQFGPSRDLFPRISPHRAVGWIRPNAKHGQKVVAPGGHEVRDSAFSGDLHDLTAVQTAQIIKILFLVISQPFGDEVLFLRGESESGGSDRWKIAMDLFYQIIKFL